MIEGRKKKFIKELGAKRKVREESGLYLVDGPKMCSEIPDGLVSEIYVTEEFLSSPHAALCAGLLRENGYNIITESEMKQISDTVTPQGILCLVRQQKVKGLRALIDACGTEKPLLCILETIQDPGNLGTIFRAGEACGVTGIIMNDRTADVYSPKVTRSTMGSVFRMPFVYVKDLCEAAGRLRAGEYTGGEPVEILAGDLQGAIDYIEFDYRKACAFMIGNESKGLSEELKNEATKRIKIPMKGNVESLNAAMAATVIGFEASRQRRS